MNNRLILISNSTTWYVYNFRLPIILRLIADGYVVAVTAPQDEYSLKLEELGCKFYPFEFDNKGMNPVKELTTIIRYYYLYASIKPAAILHYTPKPNIYGSIAARLLGIPCINNIAGLGTAFVRKGLLSATVMFLYRFSQCHVAKVFFQNKDDLVMFVDSAIVTKKQVALLPGSGVELDKYPFSPKVNNSKVQFLLISRLIQENGLMDKVILQGWSDNIEQHLASADVQLIPSLWEGFGLVAVEGMSTGLPVVASNVDGLREVLDPENPAITLVDATTSVDAWQAAIIQSIGAIKAKGAAQLASASRKQAEKFTLEAMANSYIEIYRSLAHPERQQ